MTAHYITGNLDLYVDFYGRVEFRDKIMLMENEERPQYDLKMKSLISGRPNYNKDLLYFMEYVTYVWVEHGICYFKPWLFNPERIYGLRRNDKIILPDSDISVDIVKIHIWKEDDIFRVNLPRWDRLYDMEQENLIQSEKEKQERMRNQQSLIYQFDN